jgi:hypothetical protein
MAAAALDKKRMDAGFALFNLHVNDAGKRADAEFIEQFGQAKFDEVIAPLHEEGIMAIFNSDPTPETSAYVALVTAFVNGPPTEAVEVKQIRVASDLGAFAEEHALRSDWHEPDESDVSARVVGDHLDNAMGSC